MARREADHARSMRVAVVNHTRLKLPPRLLIEKGAGLALTNLRSQAGGRPLAVALVCVGQKRMKDLNRRFTGRSELTDVLSFPECEVDREEGTFRVGDVVICSEAARRAARARGIGASHELMLYAIHGWLHLAGYRDATSAQKARMVKAEKRIMNRLGLRRAD